VTGEADLRVSDDDREQAALAVRDAAADGRLTLDELTERLDLVYAGRTRGELDAVLTDLGPPAASVPATTPRRRVVSVLGGSNLRGRFRLEGELQVVSVMGGSNIDLRGAEVVGREVTIGVFALAGGVNIFVPEGVAVDADGVVAIAGGRSIKVAAPRDRDAPRITIRGVVVAGGLSVQPRRRQR
jgi:hypothetical protein